MVTKMESGHGSRRGHMAHRRCGCAMTTMIRSSLAQQCFHFYSRSGQNAIDLLDEGVVAKIASSKPRVKRNAAQAGGVDDEGLSLSLHAPFS